MKNKVTAALLAFFLGAFGIHRFYLGQVGKGLLYLLFCWTPIPWFIAFIDFIVFLAIGEKKFNLKYNPELAERLYAPAPSNVIIHQHGQQTNLYGHNEAVPQRRQQRQQEHARRQQRQGQPVAQPPKRIKKPLKDPYFQAGNEKYSAYDFEGAITEYQRSLNVKGHNPKVHFNLACLYSVTEQTEAAYFHLEKAVEQGFYDFEKIQNHDHLAFLRSQQPRFDNFVENGYKKRTPPAEEPAPVALPSGDLIAQLERLAKMRDVGLLTEAEFTSQKVKILQ